MKKYLLLLCVISEGYLSFGQAPFKPIVTTAKATVSLRALTPAQNQAILKKAPRLTGMGEQTLSGVIPGEGTRGTTITISGQNFGNSITDVVVKVNGIAAIVTGISDNQIMAIVPDRAGTGPITVTAKGKLSWGVGFIYDWNGSINFIAGVSANAPGYADGTGASVKFNHPTGLARDTRGNIYIADCENNRIRKMNNFGEVTTIAGSGAIGSADGMGTAASFHHPYNLAVDAAGNVYVADIDNSLLRKITPAGMVTTLARGIGGRGGVCVDAFNNIYVGGGDGIQKVTPAGVVSILARGFNGVAALICKNNELYVADASTISKVSPSGGVVLIAGTRGSYSNVDGYGAAAQFAGIVGMSMDASGVIYITEENADDYPPVHIRRVDMDGFVQTIGGVGLGTGMLAGSVGDATNSFYQADMTWNCIRKVTIQ